MTKFTITLPDKIASLLDTDKDNQGVPRSTLIAQCIEQRYSAEILPLIDYAAELSKQEKECQEKLQRLKQAQEDEVAYIRQDCERGIQKLKEDYEARILELNGTIDTAHERNRELNDELQQERHSREIVVTGLQHELELAQQKAVNLEGTLHTERGYISELRQDKEQLQKQLELVTLRLPAPKVGFWARLFGSKQRGE